MTGGGVSEGGIGKSVAPAYSATDHAPAPTGAVEGGSPPASAHPASQSEQFAALAIRASGSRQPAEPQVAKVSADVFVDRGPARVGRQNSVSVHPSRAGLVG